MSNWDFRSTGRPADHRETWQSREDMAAGETEAASEDLYPLTYERGWPGPATPQPASPSSQPWPPAPFPGDEFQADDFQANPFQANPFQADDFQADDFQANDSQARAFQANPFQADEFQANDSQTRAFQAGELPGDAFAGGQIPAPQPGGALGAVFGTESGASFDERQWPPRRDGGRRRNRRIAGLGSGRRLLILAGIAGAGTAIGVAAVLLTSSHRSAQSAAAPPGPFVAPPSASPAASQPMASSPASAKRPPITLAQAEHVVAGYTSANNSANAQRSDTRLATIETASSLAIDAGLYRVQQAAGARPYPAFGPVNATYYIPRAEPGGGPHWFAVQVSNAFFASPGKVTSTEYLLFTQATAGGPWRNAIEPYVLPGASTPRIAVGSDGMATAVSTTATSLAIPPGQLAASTAASLDGTGAGSATAVAGPSDLADQSDQRFWRGKLPSATVTDTHAPATGMAGQAFALLTTDGGALVFYADSARLSLTPPPGTMLHLTVPGLYSPAQALPQAGLAYLDQFAAYDPPTGAGPARVVADYSGLTGKNLCWPPWPGAPPS